MQEPMVNRINAEPPSFLGLGATEFSYLLYVVGAAAIGVAILIGIYLSVIAAAPIAILFAFAAGWNGARFLRDKKRNRPDRYYIHATWLVIVRWLPFLSGRVIVRSGNWCLGRTEHLLRGKGGIVRRKANNNSITTNDEE